MRDLRDARPDLDAAGLLPMMDEAKRQEALMLELNATATVYRGLLTLPPTPENIAKAEVLEDQLYHAGLALKALDRPAPNPVA